MPPCILSPIQAPPSTEPCPTLSPALVPLGPLLL